MRAKIEERYLTDEEYLANKEAEVNNIARCEEKHKRIKKELGRLRRQFAKIDKSKKSLVQTTITDVAYMTVEMEDLRDAIIRAGTQVTYKNGENQYGTKQNPDAQLYLTMSQRQTAAMKILLDCLPKTEKPPEDDGFDAFLMKK